jgi:hypothetical protein
MDSNPIRLLPLSVAAYKFGVPSTWLRDEALAGHIPHLSSRCRLFFDPISLEAALIELFRKGEGAEEGTAGCGFSEPLLGGQK